MHGKRKCVNFVRHKPKAKNDGCFGNTFLVLVIILFAPLLLNMIRVPYIVGLIVAGVAVGPFGFNLLDRDSSFEIFGTWYGKLPYDRHADYLLFKELTEGK